jgi:type III secretion protein T
MVSDVVVSDVFSVNVSMDSVGVVLLSLAVTVPRIAGAFLILPLFTSEIVPALVRNSFFC